MNGEQTNHEAVIIFLPLLPPNVYLPSWKKKEKFPFTKALALTKR